MEREQFDRLKVALADRYRIHRELGRGGMATVYLAEELRHERQLALKVLHPRLAATLGTSRFLREIKTTASLTHPHILPLFDSGEVGGFLYYTMPYIDGETLRHRLDREKQLPLSDALLITREVADALGFAHSRGLLHRDIKPENVLLEAGHAVLSDFGISKVVTDAAGEDLTDTGLALGTPQYMSPEQAGAMKYLDGRSDMYSLACVLYEMLAGDAPFAGSVRQVILARKALESPPPLHHIRETLPRHLCDAVARALATIPADRFRTMQEFVEALGTAQLTPNTTTLSVQPRVRQAREDLGRLMPMLLRPLEDELDVFGVTHPGKVHRVNQGSFLVCSVGRYMHVHQTSLPNDSPLPREGERQAFFAIIVDGIGREAWGGEASRIAVEVLAQYMVHSIPSYETHDQTHERELIAALQEAVTQCHANVIQRARENPGGRGMMAAPSWFLGCWPKAYVLLAGKNRCYRMLEGELTRIGYNAPSSTDSIADVRSESGATSRTAYMSELGVPTVHPLMQSWGAVYLLCSDGLTKHVSEEHIRQRLSDISSAQEACEDLLQDALDGGGTESITLVVGRTRPIVRDT
jgi:serine/threonine protein kinase